MLRAMREAGCARSCVAVYFILFFAPYATFISRSKLYYPNAVYLLSLHDVFRGMALNCFLINTLAAASFLLSVEH